MITTPRLLLIPATIAHVEAELADRARFQQMLRAEVPGDWPPPLNEEATRHWIINYLREHADAGQWMMWYFLLQRDGQRPLAVGNGGFTGLPDAEGVCEVGYSVMESHQRRGYASEAVTALVEHAFKDARVKRVIAHTLPELRPSIRVLEKCGFAFVGAGPEEGTIRYQRMRA